MTLGLSEGYARVLKTVYFIRNIYDIRVKYFYACKLE